jgi:hypothetical protein
VKKIFVHHHQLPSDGASLRHIKLDKEIEELQEAQGIEEDLSQSGNKFVIVIFVFLILLGIGTGYLLAGKVNTTAITSLNGAMVTMQDGKKSVGVSDTKAFPDSATGVIEEGGSNGEGTHKLIRDGGPSQTVYMISSVVDLDQFIGKNVTVWGQTMAAKKVPWLMDVGRVDIER